MDARIEIEWNLHVNTHLWIRLVFHDLLRINYTIFCLKRIRNGLHAKYANRNQLIYLSHRNNITSRINEKLREEQELVLTIQNELERFIIENNF